MNVVLAFELFTFFGPLICLVWLFRLSAKVRDLTDKVDALSRMGAPEDEAAPPRVAWQDVPPADATEAAEADLRQSGGSQPETPHPEAPRPEAPQPDAAEPARAAAESGGPQAARSSARSSARASAWEETLAARWMIWLGGVTVALAAVFLFRHAIDEGWLTPLNRVILGLGLGGLLLAAGERAQRAPVAAAARVVNPDYVPPALSAAGIFAVFAALFAAHALYGLMGPATAFVALGMTAYAALALSLRQGPFVALLGILAGYAVPALIESPEPNLAATFLFLFMLSFGALALSVWRRWRWFSVLTIVGALFWPLMLGLGPLLHRHQTEIQLYVLALAAAFAALSVDLPAFEPRRALLKWIVALLRQSAGIGFTLCGALLVLVALAAGFNASSFVFLVLFAALALALGVWRPGLEGLLPVAALVALAAVLIWPQPAVVSAPARVQELGLAGAGTALGPYVMPPEFFAFSRTLWAFAAVFGLGGFAALWRVRATPVWAGLSALMPVVLFGIGYWRIAAFGVDIGWAAWAVALAALLLLGAVAVRRLAAGAGDLPLGFYAAGVTAAIALAFACLLREAWLSVVLAAEVAALAWIWSRLRAGALRAVAVALLAVVVVRLVVNPMVLDYRGGVAGLFGWVLYGYGLPALFTAAAARIFARGGRDLTVTLSEIAAAGFAFLTVALQLRLWTSGTLDAPKWDLLDSAVQAIWWIVAAMLLLAPRFRAGRRWAHVGGLIVLGASVVLMLLGPFQGNNPLLWREWVGPAPLVNLIGLAFLVPALLYAALGVKRWFGLPDGLRQALEAGAGVLLFVEVTLEVRHAFQGAYLTLGPKTLPTSAEVYAYSVAWIVFALALLGAGLLRRAQGLRYASLAVLLATVAKVFLYDMADLTGLYRVASFLGLGVTLIAIGRIYRAFVFRPPEAAEDGAGKDGAGGDGSSRDGPA